MNRQSHLRLSNVILSLSSALDLVNWFVVNHHRHVASFAGRIAAEIGMNDEDQSALAVAAALHDIGAISFEERFSLDFDAQGLMKHAELGFHLLGSFKPFYRAAELVRHHHVAWDHGFGSESKGGPVPAASHVLHLADRAAVLIRREEDILKQVKPICETIRGERSRLFKPELVDVFLHVADRESFWLDAMHSFPDFSLEKGTVSYNQMDRGVLRNLSDLFRMIIDFRSPHTATHSNDVAHLSAALGRLCGFSESEAETLHIAGNLHDLGKLAIPIEVLEKPGPLSEDETFLMRSHSYHTYRILKMIGGLDDMILSAALHHECLDGTGYPFRCTESALPLSSRIVAVADTLSALTENRSYRKAMDYGTALGILRKKGAMKKLDPHLVALVEEHRDDLLDIRNAADDQGLREFRRIKSETTGGSAEVASTNV